MADLGHVDGRLLGQPGARYLELDRVDLCWEEDVRVDGLEVVLEHVRWLFFSSASPCSWNHSLCLAGSLTDPATEAWNSLSESFLFM